MPGGALPRLPWFSAEAVLNVHLFILLVIRYPNLQIIFFNTLSFSVEGVLLNYHHGLFKIFPLFFNVMVFVKCLPYRWCVAQQSFTSSLLLDAVRSCM